MPVVTSTRNPAVKAVRRLARGRRAPGDGFLVEGPQAAREALGHVRRLFLTDAAAERDADLVRAARAAGAEVVTVSDDVMGAMAGTVTPQGVVAVAELPEPDLEAALDGVSLALVCWQVRDPGNAGTIVRTADAAGAGAVVLTGGSVDARNPKAVRASAGSLFHLPVVDEPDWAAVAAACRARGLRLVATGAAAARPYTALDLTAPTALVFGNEARGLPEEVAADCDVAVAVPIHGRAESLNLAAAVAVITYEAARQRGAGGRRGRR